MRKNIFLILTSAILSTLLLQIPAVFGKEDTAQLTFSKTAKTNKSVHYYTVQKEDMLSAIVRKIPGITEKDIPDYYRMIKELNPSIKDLDRLYVGQKLILPGEDIYPKEESSTVKNRVIEPPLPVQQDSPSYRVKKGDSLIRIVHRELHITSNTQKTMLLIKSMNPSITNAHKIYVGQVILLPDHKALAKKDRQSATSDKILPDKSGLLAPSEEQPPPRDKIAAGKDVMALSPEQRLSVIKHIVTQMNGAVHTSGNYYLPVSKTEQLTIDCSMIPVLELDQRTIIFLDLKNRSNEDIKKMISERWSGYHLIKIDEKDDIIVILKKILNKTKTYEMTKSQKPVTVESSPDLNIFADWLITRKHLKSSLVTTQGLRFVYENNALLPRAVVNYARQNSLIITEISPEKGIVGKPEEIYSLPPMTVLRSSSASDFCYDLLSYLNIPAEKDVDVRVFNLAKDGFNLSIKADIVVTQGETKTIIFSRNLPPQFINILQKSGNELIFVSDQDDPTVNMEKILRRFHFVFTSGYFTFTGVDKNQPPYNFGFNGTKIKTDRDIYVVHFDFNPDMRGLLRETWSADIIRY